MEKCFHVNVVGSLMYTVVYKLSDIYCGRTMYVITGSTIVRDISWLHKNVYRYFKGHLIVRIQSTYYGSTYGYVV